VGRARRKAARVLGPASDTGARLDRAEQAVFLPGGQPLGRQRVAPADDDEVEPGQVAFEVEDVTRALDLVTQLLVQLVCPGRVRIRGVARPAAEERQGTGHDALRSAGNPRVASAILGATRSAFAAMVRAGFSAADDGKKEPSITQRLS